MGYPSQCMLDEPDIAGERQAQSVGEVVANGLCIGCGLCEAVTHGRVGMEMTAYGSLRPVPTDGFTPAEEAAILDACPGLVAEARPSPGPQYDPVWGAFSAMRYAWAGDSARRFAAATGGVLTALGCHLLTTGQAEFILHVGADPAAPMRNRWVLSETPEQVEANAGSRYAPVAPLAGLEIALQRGRTFAIIAKPCDLGAVYRLAKNDPRIDRLCVARLTLVCGGQSRLGKSQALLSEFGVAERDLSLLRYRGHGNPGLTRIETADGRAFTKTYAELWEDEAGWDIETRCKICPDALGETADIVAADVWPDANPTGEDDGFNGVIVRTSAGAALLASAVASADVVLGDPITPEEFSGFQPHQVTKKRALAARNAGLAMAGAPCVASVGLRLSELSDQAAFDDERDGTARRVLSGRFAEPVAP
jgi:coenzyme F420 hydrogenase subunit beta